MLLTSTFFICVKINKELNVLNDSLLFSDNMRYPPDEWSILPEDRFATHVVDNAEQSHTADVLLQVSRNAKLEGCFKIQLGGSEILHADCPAKESDGMVKNLVNIP